MGIQFKTSHFDRFILDVETDADSPDASELQTQHRKNFEGLTLLLFSEGSTGTVTTTPTTGMLVDANAGFATGEHIGRSVLIVDGDAKGLFYTIDKTSSAESIHCSSGNLASDGVTSGDKYRIFFDLKQNLDGHDHDGINSKSPVLADAVVTQSKLKTSMGSVSHNENNWSKETLPGGEYGFYPQLKAGGTGATNGVTLAYPGDVTAALTTSYATVIHVNPTTVGTIYAQQRYVTASGEVFWIFLLRDKITKKIISAWQAPDHPCMGNGSKPLLVSHPFGSYDSAKHEIIVINPSDEELAEMRKKCIVPDSEYYMPDLLDYVKDDTELVFEYPGYYDDPEDALVCMTRKEIIHLHKQGKIDAKTKFWMTFPDRDLLEVVLEDYEIDETSKPKWPTKKVTVGLPQDYDEAWRTGKLITPIRKQIPKPDYILVKSLKKKQ